MDTIQSNHNSIGEKEKLQLANKHWKKAINEYGIGSTEEVEALTEYRKLLKIP